MVAIGYASLLIVVIVCATCAVLFLAGVTPLVVTPYRGLAFIVVSCLVLYVFRKAMERGTPERP